jgi:hypothetical protein
VTAGAGAGAGAGGGGGGGGFTAPSQFSAAVAGVQLASRQQSSFVPFFHTVPSAARQLSTDFWANALDIGAASAADAKSIATLFSFFIDSPLEESRSCLRYVQIGSAFSGRTPTRRVVTTDDSLCHQGVG